MADDAAAAGGMGLLDTSVFVAREVGRPLDASALPDRSVVSVITLAELRAGVLASRNTATRAARMATLTAVLEIERLSVDDAVAEAWAAMRVQLAESGRRVNVNDLWIAATAVANGLPVYAQDDDYLPLVDIGGPRFIRV